MNLFAARFYTRQWENTYSYGRAVIAAAQLSVLAFTPEWALTVPTSGGAAPSCDGAVALSAYCVGGAVAGFEVGRLISVGVLLAVVSGWRPRWTAVPHAWVTLSFLHATSLPDGGEAVLTVIAVLLVPLCLVDARRWAWPSGEPTLGARPMCVSDGIAAAVQWALRAQIAGIYFDSALSKIGVPDWVNGSAMYYVTREHFFGATGLVGNVMLTVTNTAWGTAVLTWGTILVEVIIAICILGTVRLRRVALGLAIALHLGIIVVLGLWSFGLVMCGAVTIAASLPVSSFRSAPLPGRQRRSEAQLQETLPATE